MTMTVNKMLALAESLTGEQRIELAAKLLPANGLPLVDVLVSLSSNLDGSAFDELRTRLGTIYDVTSVEGVPDGLVILRQADLKYVPCVDSFPLQADDGTTLLFDDYSDALDRLRVVATDHALTGEQTIVTYVNLDTGLQVELFPVEQIDSTADRVPDDSDAEFWRLSAHAAGREALCALCGEAFNPAGPDDMTHLERRDGQPCGGPGVGVGWWR
jgi:hypothetical protein